MTARIPSAVPARPGHVTALDDRDMNNGSANTSEKGMGAEVETLGAGRRCITDVDYTERIQSQSSSAHHRNLT